MIITILVDDRSGLGLNSEHGLALWIEVAGQRILFDTGQGGVLLGNAKKTNIDLSTADAIVLSHGHYDHTVGVAAVLTLALRATVFCHFAALRPRYSMRGKEARTVGMPEASKEALEALAEDRRHLVGAPMTIAPGIGLTGVIPRDNDFEDTGGPFYLDICGAVPDNLEDDLAMWIETTEGLVVVTGCAHAGLVNALDCVRQVSGRKRVRAVIGGFHLAGASEKRLELTAEALKALSPDLIVPCHCTGEKAGAFFAEALGTQVKLVKAGDVFHL